MKYALSVLTMTIALSSGAAFALPTGPAEYALAEISFSASSGITHEVMGVQGLVAGSVDSGTRLADGSITFDGDETQAWVSVNITNGDAIDGTNRGIARLQGASDPVNNTLDVMILPASGIIPSEDNGNNVLFSNTPRNRFDYTVNARGDQQVHADVYNIVISAQRWNVG